MMLPRSEISVLMIDGPNPTLKLLFYTVQARIPDRWNGLVQADADPIGMAVSEAAQMCYAL
jgi:hypothetical protein